MSTAPDIKTNNLRARVGHDIMMTDQKRKLALKGEVKSFVVYKIPLELLIYNKRNGRIISWMNKLESEGTDIDALSKDEYNEQVEQMIIDSNKPALEKTKKNINAIGQIHPGVVLNNGTVVDGNRRFTCLRQLKREKGTDLYFEAVILDPEEGLTEADIKRLELKIQHGEERPVDYNAIDNLVDVYNDIIVNRYFTTKDYAANIGKKESDVKKMLEKAELMVDYLKFINAEGKFYVARELELDGPLQEMVGILRREKDEEDRLRVKDALFTALSTSKEKDLTRYIRKIGKDILASGNREEFLEEFEDIVDDVHDAFQERESVDISTIREVNKGLEQTIAEASYIVTRRVDETAISRAQMKPVDALNSSMKSIDNIDKEQVARMDPKTKEEFYRLVALMKEKLDDL
ncbi:ParB/RepB/Spo0J family partition protein [Exiguobacterium sp. SH4S7]|uniref:ParB/RepB/Spo0J family partition protein n=1 Tax=Exiguobacterium sp. SH4S7 TaxID=2510958 RepID=UPI00103E3958|nr:ParB/RepB/Spo0J family partition protein [Exiguobacterium sp. SH4S7]TCI33876.1 ParB/RepB/Spo0J family partition protein [Exiguobacterium sp. SH4S7]